MTASRRMINSARLCHQVRRSAISAAAFGELGFSGAPQELIPNHLSPFQANPLPPLLLSWQPIPIRALPILPSQASRCPGRGEACPRGGASQSTEREGTLRAPCFPLPRLIPPPPPALTSAAVIRLRGPELPASLRRIMR